MDVVSNLEHFSNAVIRYIVTWTLNHLQREITDMIRIVEKVWWRCFLDLLQRLVNEATFFIDSVTENKINV